MPKFNAIKNNFLKGEISSDFHGRTDLDEYNEGAETLENVFLKNTGSAYKRGGSEFLFSQITAFSNTYDIPDGSRFIPIRYDDRNFFLFLSPAGVGVGPDWTVVEFDGTAVITDEVDNTGSTGADKLFPMFGGTGKIPTEDTTRLMFFRSDNTATGQSTQMTAKEISEIQYVQVGNVLYLVHPNFWPMFIRMTTVGAIPRARVGIINCLPNGTETAFTTPEYQRVPYVTNNGTDTIQFVNSSGSPISSGSGELAVSGTGGIFAVYERPPWYKNFNPPFEGIGERLRNTYIKLNGGVVRITGYNNSTFRTTAESVDTLSSTGATSDYEMSSWNYLWGFPRTVEFHEGRLVFGGSFRQPTALWASQSGDVSEFSIELGGSIAADSPFEVSLASSELQTIEWINSGPVLAVGTDRAEWIAFAPSSGSGISATNVGFRKVGAYGSVRATQPVRVGNALYFVDASGSKIREFTFNDSEQAYRGRDISFLSSRIILDASTTRDDDATNLVANYRINEPVKIISMQYSPANNMLAILDNYMNLFTLFLDRDYGMSGMTKHVLGGALDNNATPKVQSICVCPMQDDEDLIGEHLYLSVRRTIDSSDATYFERIKPQFYLNTLDPQYSSTDSDITEDLPIFVDSAVIQSNSTAFTSVTGLSHLEGETVQVLADGRYVGTKTVSSGSITLSTAANVAIVGLPYTSTIRTLRSDNGGAMGSSQRSFKRLDEILLRFNRTVHAKIGGDSDSLKEISFTPKGHIPANALPLFTGDKVVKPTGTWDRDGQITIVSDKPFPMELVAIVMRGITND